MVAAASRAQAATVREMAAARLVHFPAEAVEAQEQLQFRPQAAREVLEGAAAVADLPAARVGLEAAVVADQVAVGAPGETEDSAAEGAGRHFQEAMAASEEEAAALPKTGAPEVSEAAAAESRFRSREEFPVPAVSALEVGATTAPAAVALPLAVRCL